MSHRERVQREIQKSRKSIREKYSALRRHAKLQQRQAQERLRPLTEPLQKVLQPIVKTELKEEPKLEMDDETPDDEVLDETITTPVGFRGLKRSALDVSSIANATLPPPKRHEPLGMIEEQMSGPNADHTYGPRWDPERDSYFLGTQPLSSREGRLKIGEHDFNATEGLLELIFKRNPSESDVTDADRDMYERVIKLTGLNRRDHGTGSLLGGNSRKYQNVIKPLADRSGGRTGGGLLRYEPSTKVRYRFYDDPDEICDRLRLLVGERRAGNDGVNGEILSIVEELRELGVIRGEGTALRSLLRS